MRVIFFEYKRFLQWMLICLAIISVVVTGFGLLEYRMSLPTIKQYEPIYFGSKDEKKVAIICNVVWGEEFIPEMLQILRQNDSKITFFLGGQWVKDFPELAEMLVKEGHQIGNHGYSHLRPSQISAAANATELKKTEEIIIKKTGVKTNLFHPPYRDINETAARVAGELGYKTIMSSVDTIDWQRPAPEVIVERVNSKVHNGAIILMHPTAPTIKALPRVIKQLKEKGYQVIPVGELISKDQNEHKLSPENKLDKNVNHN